ncbi:DUF4232 domain-containing protein [Cellulomonas sp. PhB143]|uniref:DUF4232 domain-containing protein n=1 Tax=Cellulomonas sp. PhB143 TaxID=2485186 RepID=UPI0011CEB5CB|nr:DUF4232 domain-containing protein [Cellulomonas sp. PhB143]
MLPRRRAALAAALALAGTAALAGCGEGPGDASGAPAALVDRAEEITADLTDEVPGIDGVEVTYRGPSEASAGRRATWWIDVGPALDGDEATAAQKLLAREADGLAWDAWYQDGPRTGDLPARRSVHAPPGLIAADAFAIAHSPGVVEATIDGARSSVRTTFGHDLVRVAQAVREGGTPLARLAAAQDTVATGDGGPPATEAMQMLADLRDAPGFVGVAYDDRTLAGSGARSGAGRVEVVVADRDAARAVAGTLDAGGWAEASHPIAYTVRVGATPPAQAARAAGGDLTGWVSRRDPDGGTPAADTDASEPCGTFTGKALGQDAASGRRWITLALTNGGTATCTLDGAPELTFGTLSGGTADVGVTHEAVHLSEAGRATGPVAVAPGATARVELSWRGGSTALDPDVTTRIGVRVAAGTPDVEVSLADQAAAGAPTSLDLLDGGSVDVGAWYAPAAP